MVSVSRVPFTVCYSNTLLSSLWLENGTPHSTMDLSLALSNVYLLHSMLALVMIPPAVSTSYSAYLGRERAARKTALQSDEVSPTCSLEVYTSVPISVASSPFPEARPETRIQRQLQKLLPRCTYSDSVLVSVLYPTHLPLLHWWCLLCCPPNPVDQSRLPRSNRLISNGLSSLLTFHLSASASPSSIFIMTSNTAEFSIFGPHSGDSRESAQAQVSAWLTTAPDGNSARDDLEPTTMPSTNSE